MQNSYFQNLNYTLGNEDTRLELDIVKEAPSHVVSVCGSGSRVIPFLAKRPAMMTVVDVSPVQLALLKLRIAIIRQCSHEEFSRFWGFPFHTPYSPEERKKLFERLPLDSVEAQLLMPFFEQVQWNSILLEGRWEKTFGSLSRIIRATLGAETLDRFLSITDPAEHFEFVKKQFPHWRWKGVLALVSNARAFNMLLYGGQFPRKNIHQNYLKFYIEAFHRLFAQGPAQNNFFLQLCFLGQLKYAQGVSTEAEPDVFARCKETLAHTQWNFVQGDLVETLSQSKSKLLPVDFVSLSDVPSYFKPPIEQNFLQEIRSSLAPEGLVVTRNYLRIPEHLNTQGYREITSQYTSVIQNERMQMYDVHIYQKDGV